MTTTTAVLDEIILVLLGYSTSSFHNDNISPKHDNNTTTNTTESLLKLLSKHQNDDNDNIWKYKPSPTYQDIRLSASEIEFINSVILNYSRKIYFLDSYISYSSKQQHNDNNDSDNSISIYEESMVNTIDDMLQEYKTRIISKIKNENNDLKNISESESYIFLTDIGIVIQHEKEWIDDISSFVLHWLQVKNNSNKVMLDQKKQRQQQKRKKKFERKILLDIVYDLFKKNSNNSSSSQYFERLYRSIWSVYCNQISHWVHRGITFDDDDFFIRKQKNKRESNNNNNLDDYTYIVDKSLVPTSIIPMYLASKILCIGKYAQILQHYSTITESISMITTIQNNIDSTSTTTTMKQMLSSSKLFIIIDKLYNESSNSLYKLVIHPKLSLFLKNTISTFFLLSDALDDDDNAKHDVFINFLQIGTKKNIWNKVHRLEEKKKHNVMFLHKQVMIPSLSFLKSKQQEGVEQQQQQKGWYIGIIQEQQIKKEEAFHWKQQQQHYQNNSKSNDKGIYYDYCIEELFEIFGTRTYFESKSCQFILSSQSSSSSSLLGITKQSNKKKQVKYPGCLCTSTPRNIVHGFETSIQFQFLPIFVLLDDDQDSKYYDIRNGNDKNNVFILQGVFQFVLSKDKDMILNLVQRLEEEEELSLSIDKRKKKLYNDINDHRQSSFMKEEEDYVFIVDVHLLLHERDYSSHLQIFISTQQEGIIKEKSNIISIPSPESIMLLTLIVDNSKENDALKILVHPLLLMNESTTTDDNNDVKNMAIITSTCSKYSIFHRKNEYQSNNSKYTSHNCYYLAIIASVCKTILLQWSFVPHQHHQQQNKSDIKSKNRNDNINNNTNTVSSLLYLETILQSIKTQIHHHLPSTTSYSSSSSLCISSKMLSLQRTLSCILSWFDLSYRIDTTTAQEKTQTTTPIFLALDNRSSSTSHYYYASQKDGNSKRGYNNNISFPTSPPSVPIHLIIPHHTITTSYNIIFYRLLCTLYITLDIQSCQKQFQDICHHRRRNNKNNCHRHSTNNNIIIITIKLQRMIIILLHKIHYFWNCYYQYIQVTTCHTAFQKFRMNILCPISNNNNNSSCSEETQHSNSIHTVQYQHGIFLGKLRSNLFLDDIELSFVSLGKIQVMSIIFLEFLKLFVFSWREAEDERTNNIVFVEQFVYVLSKKIESEMKEFWNMLITNENGVELATLLNFNFWFSA